MTNLHEESMRLWRIFANAKTKDEKDKALKALQELVTKDNPELDLLNDIFGGKEVN